MKEYGQIQETEEDEKEYQLSVKATNEDFRAILREANLFNSSDSPFISQWEQEHNQGEPKLFSGYYFGKKESLARVQNGLKEKGWIFNKEL